MAVSLHLKACYIAQFDTYFLAYKDPQEKLLFGLNIRKCLIYPENVFIFHLEDI